MTSERKRLQREASLTWTAVQRSAVQLLWTPPMTAGRSDAVEAVADPFFTLETFHNHDITRPRLTFLERDITTCMLWRSQCGDDVIDRGRLFPIHVDWFIFIYFYIAFNEKRS